MVGLVRRMETRADIKSAEDIKILVDSFYDKVKQDEVIGFIFNEIIGSDWSHHLPIMYRFWNTVLLNVQGYLGNPIAKHIELDKRIPLQEEHYNRWLQLWEETVDTLFAGEIADNAKEKARLMLQLIATKVNLARDGKSIL
jgi:hemoglobin